MWRKPRKYKINYIREKKWKRKELKFIIKIVKRFSVIKELFRYRILFNLNR